jgi:hypothetical protein
MRLICALFVLMTTLNGKIVEFASFQDISSHLTPDTLIVLDIDDTLLIPKQMLGCDEWFCYRLNQRTKEGLKPSAALEKTLAEWEGVRHLTEMEIVEPSSESVIDSLQKQGYCVIGLTTQGLALATRTVQQLKGQGIDLSKTAPKDSVYFSLNEHGILFRDGILFTSGMPKGKALFQLCESIGKEMKRIVFVNDKATHIQDIEVTALDRSVEFVGLRYSYSDARKKAFIPEVAEYQFNHSNFANILSDEEAIGRLNGSKFQNRIEE